MNDFLLSLFLCSCFFPFFFDFNFFFLKKNSVFFRSQSFFVSLFSSSLELKRKNNNSTTVGDRNFIFLTLLPLVFLSREESKEERKRERKRAFVLVAVALSA